MNKKIAILAAACVLCAQGVALAQAPQQAASDDVTDVVAAFLASNLRQGIDGAVTQLEGYGLKIDRTRLENLLAQMIKEPYNEAVHQIAAQEVSKLVVEATTRQAEQFLAQAAAQPGAVTLPSGVIVQSIIEGTGAMPTSLSTVTMRYTGTLPDGTVFDEMTPEDTPMRALVSDLAPGMAEGLTHTRVGGRYAITIPAPLAYGSEGVPGVIPPDTPLCFTVDLIETDL